MTATTTTTTTTPRRQMNVRLPPELIKQIEADGRSKQDVVEDAVQSYFDDSSDDSTVLSSDSSDDSMMVAALNSQIEVKDQQIAELHVMLRDAIKLQLQLPPAPEPAGGGRKWWQFWRQK